jgi:hypothetical protein
MSVYNISQKIEQTLLLQKCPFLGRLYALTLKFGVALSWEGQKNGKTLEFKRLIAASLKWGVVQREEAGS